MKYLSEVKKNQTVARVVGYSIAENSGTKLITFEYEAYRGILAELNTHGMLCKNAESSRAVPIKKRIEQIRRNPYVPVYWGSNQPGMVAGDQIDNPVETIFDFMERDAAWQDTAYQISNIMKGWDDAGYHKQIVNRIGEAFTTVKGVITATEWDNFWHLRRAPDADPAIKELADCMWEAKKEVEDKGLVEVLKPGEWHTPYVEHERNSEGLLFYVHRELNEFKYISKEQALKTSAVACGQVSFRKLDTSGETVERVWERLMGGKAIHASVTQHQGTPMSKTELASTLDFIDGFEQGVSHIDRDLHYWSGQFKHWIMYRKLIPNEVCNNYKVEES